MDWITGIAALISVVLAGVAAVDARSSRRAAERAQTTADRDRRQPVLSLAVRKSRQAALLAFALSSDRDLTRIVIHQQLSSTTDDMELRVLYGQLAPDSAGLRVPAPGELERLDLIPGTMTSASDTLINGPLRAGDPLEFIIRPVRSNYLDPDTYGRALFRCLVWVENETDPYVISLDSGRNLLQRRL